MIAWINSTHKTRNSSVRIRCLEPMQVLRDRNYPVELFQECRESQYRLVVFNKTYDAAHLELACRLKSRGVKIVFDLCDNHFYNPDDDAFLNERKPRLLEMLDLADIVTVPSLELQRHLPVPSRLIRDGIRPLSRIENWQRALVKPLRRHRRNLVWFGVWGGKHTPGGIADLLTVKDRLVQLARSYDIGLTVISNKRKMFDEIIADWGMPVYYQEWGSDHRMRRNLARFDICLLPISQNPFTVCKSNNRLTLALYLNLAVVADAISSYREFAPYCVLDNWDDGLEKVISGHYAPQLGSGKAFVENHYMTSHAANDWQKLFNQLLEGWRANNCQVVSASTGAQTANSPHI